MYEIETEDSGIEEYELLIESLNSQINIIMGVPPEYIDTENDD